VDRFAALGNGAVDSAVFARQRIDGAVLDVTAKAEKIREAPA